MLSIVISLFVCFILLDTLRRIDETYTNLEDSGSDSDNNFDDMDF